MSHDHACSTPHSAVRQTLDELDFERGIWYAAQHGDIDRVVCLLGNGTHVDSRDLAGYTALHYAARNGHSRLCKMLLDRKADIDAVTRACHASALHRACSAGKFDVVRLLIANGANGHLTDSDGRTALHRAAQNGDAKLCLAVVLAYPELKTVGDNSGKVPADYATESDLILILTTTTH